MYTHAILDVTQSDALTLPVKAIVTRDGQTFCFRVEDGKAVRMPIHIGVREGTRLEVVKKQLPPSEPGEKPRWVNLTGTEADCGDPRIGRLTDGQEVQSSPKMTQPSAG